MFSVTHKKITLKPRTKIRQNSLHIRNINIRLSSSKFWKQLDQLKVPWFASPSVNSKTDATSFFSPAPLLTIWTSPFINPPHKLVDEPVFNAFMLCKAASLFSLFIAFSWKFKYTLVSYVTSDKRSLEFTKTTTKILSVWIYFEHNKTGGRLARDDRKGSEYTSEQLHWNKVSVKLTQSFPMHPSSPTENIRKPYGFLMLSGVRERVDWERMS